MLGPSASQWLGNPSSERPRLSSAAVFCLPSAERRIKISTARDGNSACLAVSDVGPGIPVDQPRRAATCHPSSDALGGMNLGRRSARCHQSAGQDHRPARRPAIPGAFPHAAALLRLQAGQRWDRHQGDPGLARPCLDHPHHSLHGLEPVAVQGGPAGTAGFSLRGEAFWCSPQPALCYKVN